MWPMVRRAVDWVLGLQTTRGEIVWERSGRRGRRTYALLTGCACIHQGLRCAVALAELPATRGRTGSSPPISSGT